MHKAIEFMKEALKEAQISKAKNNIPIGAIIVHQNQIIARAHNDSFWHAEILCIQNAQKKLGNQLLNTTIFITVEPCPMCMHAIKLARIPHVIFGTENKNEPLPLPEIIGNICENDAKELMQNFFIQKRSKNLDF
jgi:tRNA(adenine34) deaminase